MSDERSYNKWLESFEVGEVRWTERSAIRPPVPPRSRQSKINRERRFTARSYLAVCQSADVEPIRLWRVERVA